MRKLLLILITLWQKIPAFNVEVVEVRPADESEISTSCHGPGGVQHDEPEETPEPEKGMQ